jgi:hypothetical protein
VRVRAILSRWTYAAQIGDRRVRRPGDVFSASAGCVRRARLPAPLRAVGESKAQLTGTRPSQSISPFAPPAFTGFHAPTKRSDFCVDVGRSSLPPSGLPLAPHHSRPMGVLRGPMQTSQGKDTGRTAAPGPNTAPISVGFWASRSLARSPNRPGLHRASHLRSVLQRASGFFPTRPHGARPDCLATPPPACSCLRLAVASNLLRRGIAPPIQGPCLAHQGQALRVGVARFATPIRGSFPHLSASCSRRRLAIRCGP